MSERQPYSRVYWSVRNDPRLVGIYSNDQHWAAWNRLLLAADMAWPAPADLPANVRKTSLAVLQEAGVIEVQPGGLFIFHGLDAERGRRRAAASTPPKREPNGTPTVGELEALASSRAPASSRLGLSSLGLAPAREDDRPDVEAFLAVRMRLPSEAQRGLMDNYVRVFDETGPARAAQLIFSHPDDPIGALKADLSTWRDQRKAEALIAEKPKPHPRRKGSGLTGINAELASILNGKYAAEEGHD